MLTSMIKKDKAFQTILKAHLPQKGDFLSNSTFPAFSNKYDPLVPYNLSNKGYSGKVGTAFDYMANFMATNIVSQKGEMSFLENMLEIPKKGLQQAVLHTQNTKLEERFEECKELVERYFTGKKQTYEQLISASIFFADLDRVVRSGSIVTSQQAEDFLKVVEEIVIDVQQLCTFFDEVFIKGKIIRSDSIVIFHPTFNQFSKACGGADADIYIDGILYDFKTSKKLGYNWSEVAQIYGYYLLDCLCKNSCLYGDLGTNKVNKIAFYRARYGVIESYDVNMIQPKDLEETLEELNQYLKEILENTPSVDMLDIDMTEEEWEEYLNGRVELCNKIFCS